LHHLLWLAQAVAETLQRAHPSSSVSRQSSANPRFVSIAKRAVVIAQRKSQAGAISRP
jgi:hypothetical protein